MRLKNVLKITLGLAAAVLGASAITTGTNVDAATVTAKDGNSDIVVDTKNNKIWNVNTFYKDYASKNAFDAVNGSTGIEYEYNTGSDNYRVYGNRIKLYSDDPIVNFVDKKYFTMEGDFVLFGSEYGYYIHTEKMEAFDYYRSTILLINFTYEKRTSNKMAYFGVSVASQTSVVTFKVNNSYWNNYNCFYVDVPSEIYGSLPNRLYYSKGASNFTDEYVVAPILCTGWEDDITKRYVATYDELSFMNPMIDASLSYANLDVTKDADAKKLQADNVTFNAMGLNYYCTVNKYSIDPATYNEYVLAILQDEAEELKQFSLEQLESAVLDLIPFGMGDYVKEKIKLKIVALKSALNTYNNSQSQLDYSGARNISTSWTNESNSSQKEFEFEFGDTCDIKSNIEKINNSKTDELEVKFYTFSTPYNMIYYDQSFTVDYDIPEQIGYTFYLDNLPTDTNKYNNLELSCTWDALFMHKVGISKAGAKSGLAGVRSDLPEITYVNGKQYDASRIIYTNDVYNSFGSATNGDLFIVKNITDSKYYNLCTTANEIALKATVGSQTSTLKLNTPYDYTKVHTIYSNGTAFRYNLCLNYYDNDGQKLYPKKVIVKIWDENRKLVGYKEVLTNYSTGITISFDTSANVKKYYYEVELSDSDDKKTPKISRISTTINTVKSLTVKSSC